MDDVVLCEVGEDGVALLTLNRPDRLNAWTYAMQVALFDLLQTCAEDDRHRAVEQRLVIGGPLFAAPLVDNGQLIVPSGPPPLRVRALRARR